MTDLTGIQMDVDKQVLLSEIEAGRQQLADALAQKEEA